MIRKFIEKLTGKNPPPPEPPAEPPFEKPKDNWAAGDIAECIIENPGWLLGGLVPNTGPKFEERYRVLGVVCEPLNQWTPGDFVFLTLRGPWGLSNYMANAFRKVVPVKDEATTDESITLDMLIGKTVKEPADVPS